MIPMLVAVLIGLVTPTIVVDGTTLPASAIITIKDKTYVSLRAAADALNADVAFDGRTKTVTLTTVVRQAVMHLGVARRADQRPARDHECGAGPGARTQVMLPLRGSPLRWAHVSRFDSAKHRVVIVLAAEGSATLPGAAPSPDDPSFEHAAGDGEPRRPHPDSPAVYVGAGSARISQLPCRRE